MRCRVGLVVVGVVLVGVGAAWAAEVPVAVSPGSSTGSRIGDLCPTFSWGEVDGAKSYELVVYRLGEESEEAQRVLRQDFPGSVDGWTPSLDQCLERGGKYAWSIRAVGEKAASEWSAPSLFEVTTGPSEAELQAALEVVKAYLQLQEPPLPRGPVTATNTRPVVASPAIAPVTFGHSGVGKPGPRIPAGETVSQTGSAARTGQDSVGRGTTEALFHLVSDDIEIPDGYISGEEAIIEGQDAVLGLYSSDAGTVGSAVVFGETPDDSLTFFEKWAIVRETSTGGQDLLFTFGGSANYSSNPVRFEIGNDGVLSGMGIPRAFGVVSANAELVSGSPSVVGVSHVAEPILAVYTIEFDQFLFDCASRFPVVPIVITPVGLGNTTIQSHRCPVTCTNTACKFLEVVFNGLGGVLNTFSFVVW